MAVLINRSSVDQEQHIVEYLPSFHPHRTALGIIFFLLVKMAISTKTPCQNTTKRYRIGVDVGGTNTDAVVLDTLATDTPCREVLASQKTPTTPKVTDGIKASMKSILAQSKTDKTQIASLTIGTTHFINAIIEYDTRRLSKVAVIQLSKSYTREIPPFSDFPPGLAGITNGCYGFADGGLHIEGTEEAPLNEKQVVKQCSAIRERGIKSVVVYGVFAYWSSFPPGGGGMEDHTQRAS